MIDQLLQLTAVAGFPNVVRSWLMGGDLTGQSAVSVSLMLQFGCLLDVNYVIFVAHLAPAKKAAQP